MDDADTNEEHDEACLDYNVDKECPECICKKKVSAS